MREIGFLLEQRNLFCLYKSSGHHSAKVYPAGDIIRHPVYTVIARILETIDKCDDFSPKYIIDDNGCA